MSADNLVGQHLGQYELRALLGAGGMGAVYRGFQASLRREVAVKVLPPILAQDATYIARFNREAEVSASLEHAHIVPVYDYGTQRGIGYVVMRLLTGGSLADRLRFAADEGHSLPASSEISAILPQLASALDYAHQRGVIHRDLKPGNIMFDNQGDAFLVDFGIAKLLSATTALTETGVGVGTPSFMAPEQWRSEPLTPATDQYALAIVVYVMLTGHLPFEADTPFQAMHKHLNEPPTPLQAHRPEIPAAVSLVLDRALAKDPAQRFPTVTAFAQAFEGAMAGAGTKATGFFLVKLPQMAVRRPSPTPNAPPKRRSSLLVGVVVAVLALAVLAFALTTLGKPGAVSPTATATPLLVNAAPSNTAEAPTVINTSVPVLVVLPSATVDTATPKLTTTVDVSFMPTPTLSRTPTTVAATRTRMPVATDTTAPMKAATSASESATLKVAAGQPLLLGLSVSLTGEDNLPTANDIQRGVELALKARPTVTVGGKAFPVTVHVQNDGCTNQGGEAVAHSFITHGAAAVIGPQCSNGCRTAAPVLDAARYTSISPTCTVTDLTQGDFASFNRDVPSDALQSLIAAEYLYQTLGVRKIATIVDDSHYGAGVVAIVSQHFTELGGQVVAAKSLIDGDLAALLPGIVAQHPQLIYFGGTSADAALLAQMRATVGLANVIIMGPDRMRAGDMLDLTGSAAQGIYGTTVIWAGSPGLTALRQQYKDSYGQSPNGMSYATAYDAVNLLLDAIEANAAVDASGALTVDRAALQTSVRRLRDFHGVTGTLNADGTGNLALSSIGVYQLVDSQFAPVAVGRLNPDTGAVTLEKTG